MTPPARASGDIWMSLRRPGVRLAYDPEHRCGVLPLGKDAPPLSREEASSLFERLDHLCLKVTVLRGQTITDYERDMLPSRSAVLAPAVVAHCHGDRI
jgi:hypothetical protein